MSTSTLDVEITIKKRSRQRPEAPTEPRIPRIARLMALAIKFQDMVDRGEVRDYADLARLGYVTRARITQIMNLLNLAPDIQEEILWLRPTGYTAKARAERILRSLVSRGDWSEQRQLWRGLTRGSLCG